MYSVLIVGNDEGCKIIPEVTDVIIALFTSLSRSQEAVALHHGTCEIVGQLKSSLPD